MAEERSTRPPEGKGVCPTCQGTGLKHRRTNLDCGGTGLVVRGIAGG